jgi:tetratricopeptide (TPR) repeat protein
VITTCFYLFLIASPVDAGAPIGWRPINGTARTPAATRESVLRLLRQGRTAEADSLLGKALEQGEPDVELGIMWGRVRLQLGNLPGAESAFRLVLEAEPDNGQALAGLAEVFARDPASWDRRQALHAFLEESIARLLALGTDDGARSAVTASIGLADFERAVGLTVDARARLNALSTANLLPEQRRLLGILQGHLDRDDQVRALENWPDPVLTPTLLAALDRAQDELARQNAAQALKAVDVLLATQPTWKESLRLRSQCLISLGRHDDAMATLEALTRLAPTDAQAWRSLGLLLAQMGGRSDMALARMSLTRALALAPGYSDLWLPRAQVSLRLGDLESARVALSRHRLSFPEKTNDAAVLQLESLLKRAQAEQQSAGSALQNATRPITPEAAEKLAQAKT